MANRTMLAQNPSRPENHKNSSMLDDEAARRQKAEENKRKFNLDRKSRFKPPVVRDINDIKRILHDLGTGMPGSNISAVVDIVDDDGKSAKVKVASTSPNKTRYAMIRDGLAIFKNRSDVNKADSELVINKKKMKQPAIMGNPTHSWIDSVIERWTGGKRSGFLIMWEIGSRKYYFDIFEMKLFGDE